MKPSLDVGSGRGGQARFHSTPRGDICIDIGLPESGRPEIFILADGNHMPFRDDSFRSVSAHNVLEHTPNPRRMIEEMLRVAPIAYFTQDKLWSLGSYATPDHLWFQVPGFRFRKYPRTRLGIHFSELLQKILLNRPVIVLSRPKYKGRIWNKFVLPHSYWVMIKGNSGKVP